jgi:hypothetical protein
VTTPPGKALPANAAESATPSRSSASCYPETSQQPARLARPPARPAAWGLTKTIRYEDPPLQGLSSARSQSGLPALLMRTDHLSCTPLLQLAWLHLAILPFELAIL